jgi:glucose-1-phosphate thymidylyltransferase
VAFADTLFRADFKLDTSKDGVLWVQKIEDPRQFGVVVLNEDGVITEFKEKPLEFVSDLAMIGIYYFNDGAWLREELQYLIDHNIMNGGEYQLPDALRNMVKKGAQFTPGAVQDWMDCGNKDAMVDTNTKYLAYNADKDWVSTDAKIENSVIIQPCYVGTGAIIKNSVVGPGVSLGEGCVVESSVLKNSIVLPSAHIHHANLVNSMIGTHVRLTVKPTDLSLGDYSVIKD